MGGGGSGGGGGDNAFAVLVLPPRKLAHPLANLHAPEFGPHMLRKYAVFAIRGQRLVVIWPCPIRD